MKILVVVEVLGLLSVPRRLVFVVASDVPAVRLQEDLRFIARVNCAWEDLFRHFAPVSLGGEETRDENSTLRKDHNNLAVAVG